MHERVVEQPVFAERLMFMKAAQQAITASRYDKQLSKAVLARSRARQTDPVTLTYRVGDHVFYYWYNPKRGYKHGDRWFGPASVVGIQGTTFGWHIEGPL